MRPSASQRAFRRLLIPTHHLKPAQQVFWSSLRVFVESNASSTRDAAAAAAQIRQIEMPKTAFYAVAAGRKPGIYRTWAEAESQVKGFAGAKYKKFPSEGDARSFISGSGSGSGGRITVSAPGGFKPGRGPPSRQGQSKPYQRPIPAGDAGPSSRGTRAESPISSAPVGDLPPNLAEIARDGFQFSKGPPHRLIVYTDGSGLGNGQRGARAGAGVYWGEGRAGGHNLAERVPGKVQTNNRGELLSIIRAIEECPYPALPLEIRTDSQYSISCMTMYLPKWIANGWQTAGGAVKNADMIRHLLVLLRRRAAPVRFKHVRGHVGHAGNEAADVLARAGAVKAECDRTHWLDPDRDEDVRSDSVDGERSGTAAAAVAAPTDIEVDVDPSWLMSPGEIAALEESLAEA